MAAEDIRKTTREMSCFRKIPDADLQLILRCGIHTSFRRQKILYYQSDPARCAYLLLSGKVAGLKYRSDESCVAIGDAKGGDWIGVAEILLSCPYLNDAIAETRIEALVYSAKAFHEVMKVPGMKEFFLKHLAKSFFLLHSQIEINLTSHRLIQYMLLHCVSDDDGSSVLNATQDEIALAIGVTRETVNKHLHSFQNEGVLFVGRGSVRIPRLEALENKLIVP